MGERTDLTPRARQLLAEAREHLATADEADRRSDAAKWAAAERMWKAKNEEGATWRAIADVVGLAHVSVQHHVAVWARFGSAGYQGRYTDAYMEVRGRGNDREAIREREAKAYLRDATPEQRADVAQEALADPEVRKVVHQRVRREQEDERARRASGMEQAEASLAPIRSAAATLGSIGLLDEARALRRNLAWAVENDARLPSDAVDEFRSLLVAMDHDLVVYGARHGYPAGHDPLGVQS